MTTRPPTRSTAPATRACVVADVSDSMGWGHLSRAGGLAVALSARGVECDAYAYGRAEALTRDGIVWHPAGDVAHIAPALRQADLLVLDSYELAIEEVLEGNDGVLSVVFQDHEAEISGASLPVSIAAGEGTGSKGLHGPEYACLRPEYWGLPVRRQANGVRRVLVAAGSGRGEDLGVTLAAAAREAIPEAEIALVASPGADRASPPGISLVPWRDSLLSELLAADLAITAAGQTMLETVATGAPCIALETAENQRRQLTTLARHGAVAELRDPTELGALLSPLAADATRMHDLTREAQRTVDGYGALRIAFQVISLLAGPA